MTKRRLKSLRLTNLINYSATVIQKYFRGHKTRITYKKSKKLIWAFQKIVDFIYIWRAKSIKVKLRERANKQAKAKKRAEEKQRRKKLASEAKLDIDEVVENIYGAKMRESCKISTKNLEIKGETGYSEITEDIGSPLWETPKTITESEILRKGLRHQGRVNNNLELYTTKDQKPPKKTKKLLRKKHPSNRLLQRNSTEYEQLLPQGQFRLLKNYSLLPSETSQRQSILPTISNSTKPKLRIVESMESGVHLNMNKFLHNPNSISGYEGVKHSSSVKRKGGKMGVFVSDETEPKPIGIPKETFGCYVDIVTPQHTNRLSTRRLYKKNVAKLLDYFTSNTKNHTVKPKKFGV